MSNALSMCTSAKPLSITENGKVLYNKLKMKRLQQLMF